MAQIQYRANLSSASFPFLSELSGQSVIIPQVDQAFDVHISSQTDQSKTKGIPQAFYMHNVIPTLQGYESIGYAQAALPPVDVDITFDSAFEIRDSNENRAVFAHTNSGRNYVLINYLSGWVRTTDVVPLGEGRVTIAHVNGESYIYFEKVGCYKYNFATNVLDPVTLISLVASDIIGIVESSGYLLAYKETAIVHSSTVSITDFAPSTITGAGGGAVQEVKGKITVCLPSAQGFIVYTTANAVSAVYTGNPMYPFQYKEIINSGGLLDSNLVSWDANTGYHYAYTTSGLQVVSPQQAVIQSPEVTDFLAGSIFEDFDETTKEFSSTYLSYPMKKRLAVISDRYLIISYGINSYTHALLYDIAHARWGKLRLPHTDVFEYNLLAPETLETPRKSIALLQSDGTVYLVDMSFNTIRSNGVLILGKYQLARTNMTSLLEVRVENVRTNSAFSISDLYTLDGKNFTVADLPLTESTGLFRAALCRVTGRNHSICLVGGFHVVTVALELLAPGLR